MREKVLQTLADVFRARNVDVNKIADTDDLGTVLGWDSMDVVDMAVEMERRWSVRLADDLPNRITLGELVERVIEASQKSG